MNTTTPTLSVPKPRIKDVVDWMRRFAIKGKTDLRIRSLVEDICRELEPGDYASEVLALYYWVCMNTRYMRDIHDIEFLKEPAQALDAPALDCDDMSTLLSAMLMACGNQCQLVLVSFRDPPEPSHVFVQVKTPKGPISLDPVANRDTDRMLARVTKAWVVPVEEGTPELGRWTMSASGASGASSRSQMTYSVYDYVGRKYQYWTGSGVTPSSGWFRAPKGDKTIPERLAVRLPADARLAGSGTRAKGLIATREPSVGSVQDAGPSSTPGSTLAASSASGVSWVQVLAAFVAGWWFGRRK